MLITLTVKEKIQKLSLALNLYGEKHYPAFEQPRPVITTCVLFFNAAANGLAEYQMLLMMAKLSTGWTLSSSFSTLDPKQMKQISATVIAISVLEVRLNCWLLGAVSMEGGRS